MTATDLAAPGSGLPPAAGTGGAATVARGGRGGPVQGTRHAAHVTGATLRQLDHWCRTGLIAGQMPGSGRHRTFDDADLETIAALGALARLGCQGRWLQLAADTVRAARVAPGEWLLVTIAGHTLRCAPRDFPGIVHHQDSPHAAWLIPLTAFDHGRAL